ncbi:MAG TPA: DUF1622 domain-containing protein [Actinomycetota bacterium]
MEYEHIMEDTVRVFELVGVAVLIVGGLLAFGVYGMQLISGVPRREAFDTVRSSLGRAILLGLEVLVVADIIRTIVVTPTLSSAATLGVIVLVRVVLSFAIDVEVDGVAPWRKGKAEPPVDRANPL